MLQWELCPFSLPCLQNSKCPKAWNSFPGIQHNLATSCFGLPGRLSPVCCAPSFCLSVALTTRHRKIRCSYLNYGDNHFSPPSKRLHGSGYIKNNSRTVILTSSRDWVRPIFIFCKLQLKETDYACKVFKNVTISISVSGKTLRLWYNRSMLVCVITEQLWTNVLTFLNMISCFG